MRIGTLIMIFLIIGAVIIIWQANDSITSKEGQKGFASKYFTWLKTVGKNAVSVTAHAIKDYDWIPNEENNSTENITPPKDLN